MINKYTDIVSRFEIEELLAYLFNCSRTDLYSKELAVGQGKELLLDSLVQRRLAGEPLQYITGRADFMGMDFKVRERVFIPRPETEILVNAALDLLHTKRYTLNADLKILDLCTGSGCIAIGIAKAMPAAEIVATDISEDALKAARENAVMHDVAERIKFYKGDLFEPLVFDKTNKFDIIVCNPPYIKSSDMGLLQREVRREPGCALDGGPDGLEFYRLIARDASKHLKTKGALFLEIGLGESHDARKIFSDERSYMIKDVIKDFAEIDRVLWIDLL
ncbi:MAG: peptide chain release factor N(5)-glutamine methyltransferase [Candidatus Omnitrophica bacterium]|nr:peptide chain release factor N(5)-glutamine methyltransferase [Candidatus Omnitrophota bacterium]MBU4149168.1 peptide chain release factor N(5)-glutamine methyltransferase [Candidatus Omnitrophota bacterium]